MLNELYIPDIGYKAKFWSKGSGTPLLYLHGFNGLLKNAPFLNELALSYHVIAPPHPGFAGSSGGDEVLEMLDVVLLYQEILERLEAEQPIIMGHSLGGMFAAELAAASPKMVNKLVLISPFGLWFEPTPIPDFLPMDETKLLKLLWHDSTHSQARSSTSLEADFDTATSAIEKLSNFSMAANYLWPIPDRGLRKRLRRITQPTLLVWGEEDGLMGLEYAEAFKKLIPNAVLKTIASAGHFPMLEQPEAFHQAVIEFLETSSSTL